MTHDCAALLVVTPLLAALLVVGCGWTIKKACFPISLLGLGVSVYCSLKVLTQVLAKGAVSYYLGAWPPPWGIAYEIDALNGVLLVAVAAIAFVNLLATKNQIATAFPDRSFAFYSLYLLFVTGLLGIVATGDLFNLYVLLEIASITGYALVAMGDKRRAPISSLHYVFMGTIGASFYLLGVGYIYIKTGSLNMADVSGLLPAIYGSKAIFIAFIFCILGAMIKMGLFPLHVWLPNAYTYAPSPAASLMAPLMTKVMVYVMLRLMITVFTPQFAFTNLQISHLLVGMGCLAIFMGALLALSQQNLKRMLTYIIVSEIGYMMGGAWLGNKTAMTGAILHLLNDTLMTFCVFLAVGAIGTRFRSLDIKDLKGLFSRMPFTMAALVAGALSIIGVPPTCGFFSKWYLITGAMEAGNYVFVVALLFSSLVCVILFFRVFEVSFFGDESHGHHGDHEAVAIHETSLVTILPLLVVASGLILLGLYNGFIVSEMIEPVLSGGFK